MTARPTARHALRLATAEDHDRVDAAFSRFDLSNAAGYRAFLLAQAGAVLPLEAALDRSSLCDVLPDWPGRRRSVSLRADLAALGVDPAAGPPAATPGPAAAQLGLVYVLEGSRLGGQLLARSVPSGFPRAFLDAASPKLWRSLTEILDTVLVSVEDQATAVFAAREAFSMFERSARDHGTGEPA